MVGVIARQGPHARRTASGCVKQTRVRYASFGTGVIISNDYAVPGFSGGPVLNARNEVVGMTTALRPGEALVLSIAEIYAEVLRLIGDRP